MIKVLKNLRKSLMSVIVIVLLLCLQAATDLALPDYTSKIVNIGIQQGGIENVSPEAIRKEQMENLLLFTNNKEEIINNYTLVSKNNISQKQYDKYQKKYPGIENQDLYIINNLNKEEQEKLDSIISKPLMIMYSLTNEQTSSIIKQCLMSN